MEAGEFKGWAIVEMFGHRREIGFVTTEVFGSAALFRVEVPEAPGSPARSCLVGPTAIYAINPCTEEAARALLSRTYAPLRPLALPQPEMADHADGGVDFDE